MAYRQGQVQAVTQLQQFLQSKQEVMQKGASCCIPCPQAVVTIGHTHLSIHVSTSTVCQQVTAVPTTKGYSCSQFTAVLLSTGCAKLTASRPASSSYTVCQRRPGQPELSSSLMGLTPLQLLWPVASPWWVGHHKLPLPPLAYIQRYDVTRHLCVAIRAWGRLSGSNHLTGSL